MRIDGIQLGEGSNISNLVVASGSAFPDLANEGELFFRTDVALKGVYVFMNGEWRKILSNVESLTRRQSWTVTEGENVFTVEGGYTVGSIDIYLNGLKLRADDSISQSNGINIVFDAGLLNTGDLVDIVAYDF